MPEPFIVGIRVILIIAAVLLAGQEVLRLKGRSLLGWAVLAIALALLLRW